MDCHFLEQSKQMQFCEFHLVTLSVTNVSKVLNDASIHDRKSAQQQ